MSTPIRTAGLVALSACLLLAGAAANAQFDGMSEDELITRYRNDAQQRGLPFGPEHEMRLRLQYRQLQMLGQALAGQGVTGMKMQVPGGGTQGFPGLPPSVTNQNPAPNAAAMTQVAPPPPSAPEPQTTTVLQQQMSALPAPRFTEVVARRDGFTLNGVPVVDPAGRIVQFAASTATGDYTYKVEQGDGTGVIKRGRGSAPAFVMARVTGQSGSWTVHGIDGQQLGADSITLTPVGLIGTRDTAAFEFSAGKPIRSHALPDGWSPVPLQRGDVAGTRYLLVERNSDSRPRSGSIGALLQTTKRLVGAEAADDYALLNLDTRQLTPLNIDIAGKNVIRTSECRRKNAAVNVCAKAESFESLWRTDGMRNWGHYYWRVYWKLTPQGPLAIALQNGVKELRLFDLATGKQAIAFRRGLGISSWSAQEHPDGRLSLNADWVFQGHPLDDARRLLDEAPDVRGKELEGTYVAGRPETTPEPDAGGAAAQPAQ